MSIRGAHVDGDTVIVLWDGRGATIENTTYENSYAWFMLNALTLPQAPVRTSVGGLGYARALSRMLNPSWTRCRPSRSLGTMSTTTSHTPDTATPNSNDVARFVYTWFTLFEHRARPESLTAYLADSEQLSLRFPGSELHTIQQFTDWYQELLANTTWNFHELSGLTIQPAVSGFTVGFDVDWQGAVSDGSDWPANLEAGQFRFAMRQDWHVAARPGVAAENPFEIDTLVATPRTNMTFKHDHIAIRAVDYAGTLRWYTDKLDFHVDVEWPYGDMQLAYLSNGTAKVEVLGGATAEPQPDPTSLEPTFRHEGLNHLCLAIADFDDTLSELRARGVEFVGEPFVVEEINRRLAFVKDNSGNLIELSAPRSG